MSTLPFNMATLLKTQAAFAAAIVPTTDRHAYVSRDYAIDLLVWNGCTYDEAEALLDDKNAPV
jgi:hypothetical protein